MSMERITEALSSIENMRSVNQAEIHKLKTVRDTMVSQLSSR